MSQVPTDIHQLQTQIIHKFQSTELAATLVQYFVDHQFDDWKDILHDIRNGYDSCCCKEALFQQLNIKNIEQKRNEYERLKKCLDPNTQNIFGIIFENIIKAFSAVFDTETATNILRLFKTILHDQEYNDIDSIKDDVLDVEESSIIIEYITDKIDYNSLKQIKEMSSSENIIAVGIKRIIEGETEQFIAKYCNEINVDPTGITIEYITKQIDFEFAAHFKNKEMGHEISTLFQKIIDDEGFELEQIIEDMEDIQQSLIIEGMKDKLSAFNKLNKSKIIEKKIQQIINGETNIQKMGKEIINYYNKNADQRIAKMIWNNMFQAMIDGNFTFDDVVQDIKRKDKSKLLSSVKEINHITSRNMWWIIPEIVMKIASPKPYFNITLFNFNITIKDIKHTADMVTEHCPLMYPTFKGIANHITPSDLVKTNSISTESKDERSGNVANKSLCIAKTIDIKNRKPLMYWLLNLYLKQSVQYTIGDLNDNKDSYTLDEWWRQNKYTQWIQYTHPIIAKQIKTGLEELITRTLRIMSFNYALVPTICDGMNDIARYALALHDLVYRIKRSMEKGIDEKGRFNAAPIQLDCWIIPQMTKTPKKGSDKSNSSSLPFSTKELQEKNKTRGPLDFSTKCEYHKLSHENYEIWDIEQLLNHKKCGYIQEKDYFVQKAPKDTEKLSRFLEHLLLKCTNERTERRNRYIFIIDRRNTEKRKLFCNLEPDFQKTWDDKIYIIVPKQYRNEKKEPLCKCGAKLEKVTNDIAVSCAWCSKFMRENIWLCPKTDICEHKERYSLCSDECEEARPETHGKISSEWEILPESCLSLSKSHVFFHPNDNGTITMSDPLDGYMFGLSYHIFSADNICAYWYHNGGGTIFELEDIKKRWSPWFDKVNDKQQKLSNDVLKDIDDYMKKKILPNIAFEEFEKQSKKCETVVLEDTR